MYLCYTLALSYKHTLLMHTHACTFTCLHMKLNYAPAISPFSLGWPRFGCSGRCPEGCTTSEIVCLTTDTCLHTNKHIYIHWRSNQDPHKQICNAHNVIVFFVFVSALYWKEIFPFFKFCNVLIQHFVKLWIADDYCWYKKVTLWSFIEYI